MIKISPCPRHCTQLALRTPFRCHCRCRLCESTRGRFELVWLRCAAFSEPCPANYCRSSRAPSQACCIYPCCHQNLDRPGSRSHLLIRDCCPRCHDLSPVIPRRNHTEPNPYAGRKSACHACEPGNTSSRPPLARHPSRSPETRFIIDVFSRSPLDASICELR